MALSASRANAGFSLLEALIALVIVGLLLAMVALPLGSRIEGEQLTATTAQLVKAEEALLGFVSLHGRLPCPAGPNSQGKEERASDGSGSCSYPFNGYLPASTLGLSGDAQGLWNDAYGRPLRYAVGQKASAGNDCCPWTNTSAYLAAGYSTDFAERLLNLKNSTTSTTLELAAVVLSLGKNASSRGSDELENQNNDNSFSAHEATSSRHSGGAFDDVVIGLSQYRVLHRIYSQLATP